MKRCVIRQKRPYAKLSGENRRRRVYGFFRVRADDVFSTLTYEEQTDLNVFFSNFSEVYLQDYDADAPDVGQLIDIYSWPAATGEPFWDFSQVRNLFDNGDGTYTARLEIYAAGLEYEGNKIVYEPMDRAWGNDVTPEYRGQVTALVKQAEVNGKKTYQLLGYSATT